MRELLIATRNESKVPEIRTALQDLPFTIITLNDTNVPKDYLVEEPGNSYEAHAAIKAILYGKKAGKLALADDAGVEVDALDGWPGVHAADWREGSDSDRLQGLLEKMKDVPEEKRGALFRATVALFDPASDTIRFSEGACKGRILREPRGERGFGYDSIFFSDDLQMSFGEAPLEERARVSHRARALMKARELLSTEFM